jgi:hypothetical protein
MEEKIYTLEELLERVKNVKALSPEDAVDFSWPDGFLAVAKSLGFLPDDQIRVQTLLGILSAATTF